MNPQRELRKSPRQSITASAKVLWEDRRQGRLQSRGRCVNVSDRGAGLILSDPVPEHAIVNVTAPQIALRGYGTVRHCHWTGAGYRVGVEFTDHIYSRLPPQQAQFEA